MDRPTAHQLLRINRRFYRRNASDFSATRRAPWPGWLRLGAWLRDPATAAPSRRLRILDAGSGNGRFAQWLRSELGADPEVLGVDSSLELLADARRHECGNQVCAEIGGDGFLPCRDRCFDAVVAMGLLHHIPGFASRRQVLAELRRCLRAGGLLVVTFWQFGTEARFERRRVAWDDYNRQQRRPVAIDELEPGDHLLAWGSPHDARQVRYCHHADDEEARRLLAFADLESVATYRSDGSSGALNLYHVLRRHQS